MLNGVGLWMGWAGYRWPCGLEISGCCVWPHCQEQEWTNEGNRVGVGVGRSHVPYILSPTSASNQVWCRWRPTAAAPTTLGFERISGDLAVQELFSCQSPRQ